MKIKIFALTHKKFEVPQDKMYQPLQVGREEKEDLGYLCDNTGDNISAENCYYSELTGLYWIWKNVHTYKYVGTCHYRRYLLNEQEKIFTEAISEPDIVALSIATRPDCLGNNVLGLLEKLNKIKPVWVELGLQTIHEKSADYIRRMYPLSVYDSAAENLHKIGVNVITHLILGLPNESKEMMLDSVKYVGNKTDGIKLQLLHILKNTDLCDDYENGKFDVLSMEDYIDILCDCVEVLPENVVIHRLTGDGDKKLLVAPMWSADKKRVLNSINREFAKRDITQGRKAK